MEGTVLETPIVHNEFRTSQRGVFGTGITAQVYESPPVPVKAERSRKTVAKFNVEKVVEKIFIWLLNMLKISWNNQPFSNTLRPLSIESPFTSLLEYELLIMQRSFTPVWPPRPKPVHELAVR
jgi:hypothetical protein